MRFFISLITFLCLGFNATAQGHDPSAADFIKDVYTKMLSSNPSKAKRYFKRRCRTKIKRMSAERHCELLTGCLGITSSDIDSHLGDTSTSRTTKDSKERKSWKES